MAIVKEKIQAGKALSVRVAPDYIVKIEAIEAKADLERLSIPLREIKVLARHPDGVLKTYYFQLDVEPDFIVTAIGNNLRDRMGLPSIVFASQRPQLVSAMVGTELVFTAT